ncbi:MAG: hypothetical protein ACI4JW_06225 [Oscillospiraceae bacterium]
MPAFGKKEKEESINDKMVRLFKEGKPVAEIAKELGVRTDVITNVIRRRCGEDSIPETVIRSKNAMPQHNEEVVLKADMANPSKPEETAAVQEAEEETATEGLTKLERFMLEKEKKKQEEAASEPVAAPEPKNDEMESVSMEGISLDDLAPIPEPAPVAEPTPEPEPEMEGISISDIPDISEDTIINEAPVTAYEAPAQDKPAEEEKPAEKPAAAPSFDMPAGGSAFDKMKAFAQAQVAANNEKLKELEAKLGSVEGDYTAQLEAAEKDVEASKVAYEEVLTRGDVITDKRAALQAEHRAALARAEEDYRRKLAELDDEYNNATAIANKDYAEKETEINAESDAIAAEKETAKNNFLTKQSVVTDIKKKIDEEVVSVKKQIESIKEENAGYEQFLN